MNGHDFSLEPAARARVCRARVGSRRHRILRLARDPPLLRHVFARDSHGNQAVLRVARRRDSRINPAFPLHRICRHRLHSRTDSHIVVPSLDSRRDVRARLQPRRALSIRRSHRHLLRKPREKHSYPALVRPLTRRSQHRSDDDVPDVIHINFPSHHARLQHRRDQVIRRRRRQSASLRSRDGRSARAHDDDVIRRFRESLCVDRRRQSSVPRPSRHSCTHSRIRRRT